MLRALAQELTAAQAAQPALLYIVPAVLGTVGLHSLLRGEVVQLWNWSEEDEEEKAEYQRQTSNRGGGAQT